MACGAGQGVGEGGPELGGPQGLPQPLPGLPGIVQLVIVHEEIGLFKIIIRTDITKTSHVAVPEPEIASCQSNTVL